VGTTVHVVAQEEVVAAVREALVPEDSQKVVELTVKVAADGHRSRQLEAHRLSREDASNFVEEAVDVLEMREL
jgi:hypothetical protein